MPVCPAEGRCDLPDHRCIWDWIKYSLRAHAVQFSKRKAKEKKRIRRTYCKMNLTMQRKRSNVTLPIKMQATLGILIRRKKNWNIFYEEKLQSIIIRARARRCEHGEKSTKYFLNLEKRNHVKKHVRKLKIQLMVLTFFCSTMCKRHQGSTRQT